MTKSVIVRLVLALLLALGLGWSGAGQVLAASAPPQKGNKESWKAFEWSEIVDQLKESGSPWLPILKVPTLHMGAYVLEAGAKDLQKPHGEDEVYYVVEGEAVLQVSGKDRPVQAGSIVFVAAGVEHHFHSIKSELKVLVFFSSAKPPKPRPKSSIE